MKIHFLTIVLNGMPFIRRHLEVFQRLKMPWHWHIVEGLASLTHDTDWSIKNGASIDDSMHSNGLSLDGTSEYLDSIASDKVTVYRPPTGCLWDGKLAMVNAPMPSITTDCLLWQIDSDEIWDHRQIADVADLFRMNPTRHSAFYRCRYFVGPDRWISNRGVYANHTNEWLRTWRFKPGDTWSCHEPPILTREGCDVGQLFPFTDTETEIHGLVFQHYAYATESQLRFKESYYGYKNALEGWRRLQAHTQFPAPLSSFFPWVKDEATVDITPKISL